MKTTRVGGLCLLAGALAARLLWGWNPGAQRAERALRILRWSDAWFTRRRRKLRSETVWSSSARAGLPPSGRGIR